MCIASSGGWDKRFCLDVHADRSDPLALKVGSSPNSMHDCGGSSYDLPPRADGILTIDREAIRCFEGGSIAEQYAVATCMLLR